jgi:hypothetical protein
LCHLTTTYDSTRSRARTEEIEQRIFFLRGHKMMLSTDLASLYEVEARALVQAVKRNIERFPEDFMFQLNQKEFLILKSQIVISRWGGLRRATPYAFTEQGVATLPSALRRIPAELMTPTQIRRPAGFLDSFAEAVPRTE